MLKSLQSEKINAIYCLQLRFFFSSLSLFLSLSIIIAKDGVHLLLMLFHFTFAIIQF